MRPVTPIGLLAGGLSDLLALLVDGAVDPAVVTRRIGALADLAGGLDDYTEHCTSAPSAALADLARASAREDWAQVNAASNLPPVEAEMLSGHLEGRFLRFLIQVSGARRVLEIGMFSGYSALAMAEAVGPEGRVLACEINPAVADRARQAFAGYRAGERIDVRVGPAADTLASLGGAGERFELIFIDADKAGYRAYLDSILELDLLAEGGTICVDNTLLQGEPWAPAEARSANGATIAAFNEAVIADPRVEQILLPIRDGITLIRRASAAS